MNNNVMPITVIVAIILFIIKETVEWERRKKAEARKIKTISLIITGDVISAYVGLAALNNIVMHFTGDIQVEIGPHYHKDLYGKELFVSDDESVSIVIPSFSNENTQKNLLGIAEIDKSMFDLALKFIKNVNYLNSVRMCLVAVMKNESTKLSSDIIDLKHFVRNYDAIKSKFAEYCSALTGEDVSSESFRKSIYDPDIFRKPCAK